MKQYKVVSGAASVLLIVTVFYFLPAIYNTALKMANRVELGTRFFLIVFSFELLLTLIGFLSTRNWFVFFRTGNIAVGKVTLTIGILLFIIGAVPPPYWAMAFGLGNKFNMLLYIPATHYAVNVVAGVVIGRAFSHKQNDFLSDSNTRGAA